LICRPVPGIGLLVLLVLLVLLLFAGGFHPQLLHHCEMWGGGRRERERVEVLE